MAQKTDRLFMNTFFKALVVSEENDSYSLDIKNRNLNNLPDHDTLIRVHYSSLNYKDALSAIGNKGVTRKFPHTPGIDAAGIVVESTNEQFSEGDAVIVTSYDLGQNTPGGFGQYIRVPSEWIVPLPEGLTLKESMIYGTAGFTAAYGVMKLIQNNTQPADGSALVTGATGGVGSLAVALLDREGYSVIAATGKTDQTDFLTKLGANKVVHRDSITSVEDKPLLSAGWAASIDTIGGVMLDAVLRQTNHNGTVACCGNVLGGELHTSIYPFILRGISLMGIDSGICLMPTRQKIWAKLATDWKLDQLIEIYRECTLNSLPNEIDAILRGEQVGRLVVNVKDS